MKVIIMAAGRGTRISEDIENVPKCTLKIFEGCSLIENTINKLNKFGITDISIVLGYKSDYIKDILKNYNLKFYINPFYKITNSIVSLWFAQEYLYDSDILLLNGDVFFEEEILEQICSEKRSPILFADNNKIDDADYKFYYEDNILKKYGKELKKGEYNAEYIGIARVNRDFLDIFRKRLNDLIFEEKFDMWWEDVLYTLTNEYDIYVEDINGKFFSEIDYFKDYSKILNYIKNKNNIFNSTNVLNEETVYE